MLDGPLQSVDKRHRQ